MVLSGCVSYPDYPSGWSPLIASYEDCTAISGAYWNRGAWKRSESHEGIGYLSPYLLQDPRNDALRANVDRADVSVTAVGTLQVKAVYKNGESKGKTYVASKGEYACKRGKIEIPYSDAMAIGGPLIMGTSQGTITLAKAQDGALIIQDAASGVGLVFLVVPAVGSGHQWLRFESVDSGKQPESHFQLIDPADERVNCVSGGRRIWTKRSECD